MSKFPALGAGYLTVVKAKDKRLGAVASVLTVNESKGYTVRDTGGLLNEVLDGRRWLAFPQGRRERGESISNDSC